MKAKAEIKLTKSERKYAQQKLTDKKTSKTFKQRAQVLLALDKTIGEPEPYERIAKRVGIARPTIYSIIKAYEAEGLEKCLKFKKPPEPNRKPIVTGELEARIIAVACGSPPEGFSRWTVRSLTNKIELEIAPGISRETVRRTLKKLNLNLT